MNASTLRSRSPVLVPLAVAAGVAAVGTALWARSKAHEAERDHPPIGRFVEVDGVRLHYIERGEGPPVLLLHGNTVLLQDFIASGLVDKLAERHRVIAFDRPGYGFSQRPRGRRWTASDQARLFERALERMGADAPVVVGHSWGTLAALALALDSPGRVGGLVLASGYYYPTARPDVALTAPGAWPVIGDVLRYTWWQVLGRVSLKPLAAAMFSPRDVPHEFFDLVSRGMMLRPGQMRANAEDAGLMVPAAEAFERRYRELRLPVAIVTGTHDLIVDPDAHSMRLHRDVPHSQLIVVPDAGHMVHYADPDRLAAAVERVATNPRVEASQTVREGPLLRSPPLPPADTGAR